MLPPIYQHPLLNQAKSLSSKSCLGQPLGNKKTKKWGKGIESIDFPLFRCLNIRGAVLPVPPTSVSDHVWTGQGPYQTDSFSKPILL